MRTTDGSSLDSFSEDAVIAALRERRRVGLYVAYGEAVQDPAFDKDMVETTQSFDVLLRDGDELFR